MKHLILAALMILAAASLTVDPAVAGELIFEDFETEFPPAGWSRIHLGTFYLWNWGWNGGHSGEHTAYIRPGYDGAFEDEWLVTPARDTADADYLVLSFYESGQDWSTLGGLHEILVSTTVADDPAAFTSIWSATPATYPASWLDSERAEWGFVEIDLGAYIGETIHVAFHYVGGDTDHWWIDDVRLNAPKEHDLAVVAVDTDGDTWQTGREISPQLTLANTGANIENLTATLVIEHDGTVVYDEAVPVEGLEVDAETVVDFPSFICETGDYRFTATAVLPTDGFPVDNELAADAVCYSGQRTPLGILFTNWACGPCVDANAALDEWYPLQGDTAGLIRVHVWWPAANDPIYQANTEQSEYLLAMCPLDVTGVPTLYMDNQVKVMEDGSWGWQYRAPDAFAQRAVAGSPIEMDMSYDHGDSSVTVAVTVLDPLPAESCRLVVAVTEDDIHAPGPNGEEIHNQAFRRLFPDLIGAPVATAPGTHEYTVGLDLDSAWRFSKLRATAWVQADTTGQILNSATMVLTGDATAVDDADEARPAAVQLLGARPNPFNPQTSIAFELPAAGHARLDVYDLAGRRVATLLDESLPAGRHAASWNGRDAEGRSVPSGVYLYRLDSGRERMHGRMMLVR